MKKLKGSYTVEASLLFPFILTVIVMIIYLAFFIHDRCVMNTAAYQAALRGSREKSSSGKAIGITEKAAEELLAGTLIATENVSHDVNITDKEISVIYEGTMKIPAGILFMRINGSEGIPIKVKSTAIRKDPIKFIRECRFIENPAGRKE